MTNSPTTFNKPSDAPLTPSASRSARVLTGVIRGYQYLRAGRIAPCRFYPSCSSYAVEAIGTHGALKGSLLSLRRLSRCRPLGPHGIDLVPEPKKARSLQS